jgi:hypothetical protein
MVVITGHDPVIHDFLPPIPTTADGRIKSDQVRP